MPPYLYAAPDHILWTKAAIKAQMLHQTRIVFSGPGQTMVNRLQLMSEATPIMLLMHLLSKALS